MSDIKFNCPRCGQHLAVPTSGANLTVACPNCGQAIVVPPLARKVAGPEKPKRALWLWVVAGVAVVALLACGALIWQMHRRASAKPTPEMLYGKSFCFSWRTDNARGYNGILTFHNDGRLSGGTGSPNETSWAINEQGQLIFKHQDGRASTIFIKAHQQDGKWRFSGPFQFAQGITNLLEEVSPETVANEKWINPLNVAVCELQNNNDADSANFVSSILASVEKPGGTSPEALAADRDRMNNKVRELVQQGSLESAATLQAASYDLPSPPGPAGPPNPNHKTGGKPGPGGLVLYLPFDKPADADGTVHDESGAGNDGKVFGAQWVPDGKFGGAYQFHITNLTDRIVIPNSDTLNPDTITISVWIKTADKDGFWNRIVDKDYRNAYCFDLGGDWRGKAMRGKPGLETSQGVFYHNRPLDDNRWHHVAVTYDGRIIACFIDSVEQSRPVRHPGSLKKDDWDLCIGNSVVDYGTGEFLAFDGLIDEVRIYNRALSAAEIMSLASATNAGAAVISAPAETGSNADVAARLKQVKDLYDQGLITKDQYDQKVKEIMGSL